MGSGKTLSAISALEDIRSEDPSSPLRVLTPASLRENFKKEVKKHTDGGLTGGTPEPKSHTKATMEGPQDDSAAMRVVDEAHRARSTGSKFKKRLKGTPAEKNLLMTGTPVYNHPYEISPLVNISADEKLLPETKSRFEKKFVSEEKEYPGGLKGIVHRLTGGEPGIRKRLQDKNSLREPLGQYVDYFAPGRDNENYPEVNEETVDVAMSQKQRDTYEYMFKDLPMHLRWKVQSNLPPGKDEASKMMQFLNGPRQVANSVNAFDEEMSDEEAGRDSPKIEKIVDQVKNNPDKKQVVYSNFLESGLDPLRAVMEDEDIDYGEYTGSTGQAKREEDVRRFNNGDISTLVMSSAGGEGLDLKGVEEMHVMEPHWNEAKIDQVIARADRYKSHEDLPEDRQKIEVKRYQSQVPERSVSNAVRSVVGGDKDMTGSVEAYIQGLAKDKQKLSDQLINILEEETEKQASSTGHRPTQDSTSMSNTNRFTRARRGVRGDGRSKTLEFLDSERQNVAKNISDEQKEDAAKAVGMGTTFGGMQAATEAPEGYGEDILRKADNMDAPDMAKPLIREFGEGGMVRRFGRPFLGAAAATYAGSRLTKNLLGDDDLYEGKKSRPAPPQPSTPPSSVSPSPVGQQSASDGVNATPRVKKASNTSFQKEAVGKWLDDMASFFRSSNDVNLPDAGDAIEEYGRRVDSGDIDLDSLSPKEMDEGVESLKRDMQLDEAGKKVRNDPDFDPAPYESSDSGNWTPDLKLRGTAQAIGGAGIGTGAAMATNYGYRATQPEIKMGPREQRVNRTAKNVSHPAGPLRNGVPERARMGRRKQASAEDSEKGLDGSDVNMLSAAAGGALGIGGAFSGGALLPAASAATFAAGPVYNEMTDDNERQRGEEKEAARSLESLERKGDKVKYNGRWMPVDQPVESWRPGKKRAVLATKEDGGEKKVRLVHYGSSKYNHNYSDEAKKNYLNRARGITNKDGAPTKDDPHSANHWAIKDLWPEEQDADGSAGFDLSDITDPDEKTADADREAGGLENTAKGIGAAYGTSAVGGGIGNIAALNLKDSMDEGARKRFDDAFDDPTVKERFRDLPSDGEGMGNIPDEKIPDRQRLMSQVIEDSPESLSFSDPSTEARKTRNALPDFIPERIKDGIEEGQGEAMKWAGPAYSPAGEGMVNVNKRIGPGLGEAPEVVAHEMGHHDIHKALGKGYAPARMAAGLSSMAAPLGMIQYFRHRNENPEKAKDYRNASMGVAGTGAGLMLGDEAGASIIGDKKIRDAMDAQDLSRSDVDLSGMRKGLGKAMGTYGAATLAPLAAAGGLYAADQQGWGPFDEGVGSGNGQEKTSSKTAGGPGSGKSRDSTERISELDKSPLITIHKRKKVINHRSPDRKKDVGLGRIKYGAQTTYDIEKLGWMLNNFDEWKDEPIQVARVDGEYHLMDGHHRFLAANRLGESTLPAEVWVMDEGEVRRVTGQNVGEKTACALSQLGQVKYASGAGRLERGFLEYTTDAARKADGAGQAARQSGDAETLNRLFPEDARQPNSMFEMAEGGSGRASREALINSGEGSQSVDDMLPGSQTADDLPSPEGRGDYVVPEELKSLGIGLGGGSLLAGGYAAGAEGGQMKTACVLSQLGQEKSAAASNHAQDFAAGIDPFGAFTNTYATENQEAGLSEANHRSRQAVNTVGGVIGGGLAVPSFIGGVDEALSGARRGSGVVGRLAGAGAGLIEGAQKPIRGLIDSSRARKAVGRSVEEGGTKLDDAEVSSFDSIKDEATLDSVSRINSDDGLNVGPNDIQRFQQDNYLTEDMGKALDEPVTEATSSLRNNLAIGGAIGGAGAAYQYERGRQTAENYGATEQKPSSEFLPFGGDEVDEAFDAEVSQEKEAAGGIPSPVLSAGVGAIGGIGSNALHQGASMHRGSQQQFNPYSTTLSGLAGAGLGAGGSAVARRADDVVRKGEDVLESTDEAVQGAGGKAEQAFGDMSESAQSVDDLTGKMDEVVDRLSGRADETLDQVNETNEAVRGAAEKVRDNRFLGMFSGKPDLPKEGAAKAEVGEAFIDWARRTDSGSPDEFRKFLADNTDMSAPDVRARPTRPDDAMNNVKFDGGANGPEMMEVQTDDGAYILPGVSGKEGTQLEYHDRLGNIADADQTGRLRSVEPIPKSRVKSNGPTETEFRLPVDNKRVPANPDRTEEANALLMGGVMAGGGYAAHRKQQGKDVVPDGSLPSLPDNVLPESLTGKNPFGSAGDSPSGQDKNAANRDTITVEAEDLGEMSPGFDLDFGLNGQEMSFDFSMPDEVNIDAPTTDEPSAGRTTAGQGPDPNEVDVPTPEAPEPDVEKPTQMVD
jgi:hypothetical protein